MSEPGKPVKVTGGCLCGSIRYTVTFPADTKWPLDTNGTCQCTNCRKFTGSLLPQNFSVPTSTIEPPLDSSPTYKTYAAMPNSHRGFCSTCGSSIAFQYKDKPQRTELHLGTVDEEVLLGEKAEDVYHGQYGTASARKPGGLGALLSRTERSGHIWYENAIPGVTTGYPGLKWYRGRTGGEGFEKENEAGSPVFEKSGVFA